jgi:4'-phosphopantetheinyl transferase
MNRMRDDGTAAVPVLAAGWRVPSCRPPLEPQQVHVWRVPLDIPASVRTALHETLSPDERDRAGRYRFDRDRNRFTVGRGVLRLLLGSYLGIPPDRPRLCYGAQGKPALANEGGEWDLQFNLSHSQGLALVAFSPGRALGVDLEQIRPDLAEDRIAESFFSRQEVATLRALPPEQQAEAFFACWTRKEAYIKALGGGLSISLDSFDVSLAPGAPAALLRVRDDPGEASRWSLRELDPGPGFAGALVVEGHGWQLERWQIPEEAIAPDPTGILCRHWVS